MKIAISNIAWARSEEPRIAAVLEGRRIRGIEVAPTMVWPDPLSASPADIDAYRDSWERRGVRIVALQALLFGQSDLRIFGSAAQQEATVSYLKGIIELGARLGATALVFGSPKNRQIGNLPADQVRSVATRVFREIGEAAAQAGTLFCIEPNPPAYACDYLTTVTETLAALEMFSHAGLGLHLDSGSIFLNKEPIAETVRLARDRVRHFHISEPYLAPTGEGGVDHHAMATALRSAGYTGWCSIEMKAGTEPAEHTVDRALRYAQEVYGPD